MLFAKTQQGVDMKNVLILGAGKIGSLIACLLASSGDYTVSLADVNLSGSDVVRLKEVLPNIETINLDASNAEELQRFLANHPMNALVSCLPYFCNPTVAEAAKENNCHYFDLTEDTEVTEKITQLAKGASIAFAPQCGIAPGFISIAANEIIQHFEEVDTVKMRVGALPESSSNALHYALNWSPEGLINEYGNFCYGLENSELTKLHPLEGLEDIKIDGESYEAFNTSGGLGSLAETYAGKVKNMTYKTIRYPGHCEKMRFLMNELRLNQDRKTLKRIFENALPKTYQDLVLVYVSVNGKQRGEFIEENYIVKIRPRTISDIRWSAIQVTTAASLCASVDIILAEPEKYHGLVKQEQISLKTFIENRFGKYYQNNSER